MYDGGGVEPDIKLDASVLSGIASQLIIRHFIFDYATKYYFEHASQKPEGKFSLSEADYQAFLIWLKNQNFNYESPEEKSLSLLEQTAKQENSYEDLKEELKALKGKVEAGKAKELIKYKDEIKEQLENEILSRYYYQKAMKFVSFERDKEVQEALKLFKNMPKYQELLKSK